jgi:hypothetical protein
MGHYRIITLKREKMRNKKFTVAVESNSVKVTTTRTGFCKRHHVTEFVYGQLGYNDETEKYPNYVHGEIWKQWKVNRKNQKKG